MPRLRLPRVALSAIATAIVLAAAVAVPRADAQYFGRNKVQYLSLIHI